MSHIDWPLAILLAVMFVVMSVFRWRYFRSVARRRAQPREGGGAAPRAPRGVPGCCYGTAQ